MITRLEISNYALIENVSLELGRGFTVITGETGAGKSIILKALSLLLGERADTSVIRQNEKKCFLEAEFDISDLGLKDFFATNDLEYDNISTIRREFSNSGKSRCFVNDSPVQLNLLSKLGAQLINVHSQHETLQIFDGSFQLNILDHFAGITTEVAEYGRDYRHYKDRKSFLSDLEEKENAARKEKNYVEFLLSELTEAKLENFISDEIQLKSSLIENSEKINETLSTASQIFEADSHGPVATVEQLISIFGNLKSFDKRYAEIETRLKSIRIELMDIESEMANLGLELEFGPAEIQLIKDRIDQINSLLFKHHAKETVELLALRASLSERLSEIDSVGEEIKKVASEVLILEKKVKEKAKELSLKRCACQENLTKKIGFKLSALSMADARLKIEISQNDVPGPTGFDDVVFLFKTNAGGNFAPLKKIASGGELSRLMLSLLSVLVNAKKLPTMIFDEIDTGVSGEVAAKIATEFQSMAKGMQIVAVTHLAQVAGCGEQHLHVAKHRQADKTVTIVNRLDDAQRVEQLARMISGEKVSRAAKENARLLMKHTKSASQKHT